MNKIAIIPARSGSKGLPGKNTRDFNGTPLIALSIKSAIDSKVFDRVIVSTDCERIARLSAEYGAEIPYLRSAELSSDYATTSEVIMDLIESLDLKDEDIICLLQPTSPLRNTSHIIMSFELFSSTNFQGSVVSMQESKFSPHWIFKDNGSKPLNYFINGVSSTNRQERPRYLCPNGAIYWITVSNFLVGLSVYSEPLRAFYMTQEESIDIDTNLDFELAEKIDLQNE